MKQKILVIGGTGFIGSHIVDELVKKGHEVIVFSHNDIHTPYVEFIKGDITNKEDVKKAVRDVDIIIHNAGAVGVGESMYKIEKYFNINTLGTAKLMDVLINNPHNVRKLIIPSSTIVYGEGAYECDNCGVFYPERRSEEQLKKHKWEIFCSCGKVAKPIPTKEDKPLNPNSIYAITKRDQEEMCMLLGKTYGIPTVILRYFNIYGLRKKNNPYADVTANFSSIIKNEKHPQIYEDGLQIRDFINVKDVVQANMIVLKNKNADYKIFNVGSGKPTSVIDVANLLIRLHKKKTKPVLANKYRAGDIRHCYADISKIKELGFNPKISIEQGMEELVKFGSAENAESIEKAQAELKEKSLVK